MLLNLRIFEKKRMCGLFSIFFLVGFISQCGAKAPEPGSSHTDSLVQENLGQSEKNSGDILTEEKGGEGERVVTEEEKIKIKEASAATDLQKIKGLLETYAINQIMKNPNRFLVASGSFLPPPGIHNGLFDASTNVNLSSGDFSGERSCDLSNELNFKVLNCKDSNYFYSASWDTFTGEITLSATEGRNADGSLRVYGDSSFAKECQYGNLFPSFVKLNVATGKLTSSGPRCSSYPPPR